MFEYINFLKLINLLFKKLYLIFKNVLSRQTFWDGFTLIKTMAKSSLWKACLSICKGPKNIQIELNDN